MSNIGPKLAASLIFCASFLLPVSAVETNRYYVAPTGSNQSPFDTWGRAATTIQAAVNKAQEDLVPGTTECEVVVSNGTYSLTSQITITNGITLRSLNGRDVTFINGNYPAYSNRCFFITGDATLDGFTITNGYAYATGGEPATTNRGGGVYAHGCSVVVRNCAILHNRARQSNRGGDGGGVAFINGASLLIDCLVARNDTLGAGGEVQNGTGVHITGGNSQMIGCVISNHVQGGSNGSGAGLYMTSSTGVLVSNCVFVENRSSRYGGGAYFFGGTVTHCLFMNNYASSSAGGAYPYGSTTGSKLFHSTIVSNRSGGSGGGVSINRGIVADCIIIRNYAVGSGGGVNNAEGRLTNCLIAANSTDGQGGGVYKNAAAYTMDNCTILRNASATGGGGVKHEVTTTNLFRNNIVFFNENDGIRNDVSGNTGTFTYSCASDLAGGVDGNITDEPVFVDSGSGCGTNAVLGDYHLLIGSPALDAGTSNAMSNVDLDGIIRPRDGDGNGSSGYDMGAYEAGDATAGVFRCGFTAPTNKGVDSVEVVFTAFTAGPATNGLAYHWSFGDGATSGWSAATRDISHVYGYGTFSVVLTVSNELGQTASYTRPAFITVYPTFVFVSTAGSHTAPYGTWDTAATNIQAAVDTAADGLGYTLEVLVGNGTYTVTNAIAINRPVTVRGFSGNPDDTVIQGGYPASTNRCLTLNHAGAVLDGVTVSNGYLSVVDNGAGILSTGGTIRNCIITRNTSAAGGYGAGVSAVGTLLTNCVISENRNSLSAGTAGGVYAQAGTTVADCLIVSNRAKYRGGIYLNGAGAVARNCEIAYNYGGTTCGGGEALGGAFEGCLVIGNESAGNAGGLYLARTGDSAQNCTIVGNKSVSGVGSAGGLYLLGGANTPNAVNTIVWGNEAGGVASDVAGYTSKVSYCSAPDLVAGVSNNITADPQFVKPGSGVGLAHVRGNYHLKAGSPCIDTAQVLSWMASGQDLDGEPRILGGGPNRGAFEKIAPSRGSLLLIR
jgi:hypothetical protein